MPPKRKSQNDKWQDRAYQPERGEHPKKRKAVNFRINQKILPGGILPDSTTLSATQQQAWLERSKYWNELNKPAWKPIRILGAGAYGIVGLFKKKNLRRNLNLADHIVVKQAGDGGDIDGDCKMGLKWESYFLRKLRVAESEHIVKIYKEYHEAEGTGVALQTDTLPFHLPRYQGEYDPTRNIGRIFLEHCPEGDFDDKMNEYEIAGKVAPEELIWRWLNCVARALMILHRGHETDIEPSRWPGRPIIHFDGAIRLAETFKPANILQGGITPSHPRAGVFKLADFGVSIQVPQDMAAYKGAQNRPRGAANWEQETGWRGPSEYDAPEQLKYDGLPLHPRANTRSSEIDVWLLGLTLHFLLLGGHPPMDLSFRTNFRGTRTNAHGVLNEFETFAYCGPEAWEQSGYSSASQSLVHLLLEMLAYDPAQRPSIATISTEAKRHCLLYDASVVPVPNLQDGAPPGEPNFSGTEDDYVLSVKEYPEQKPKVGYDMPLPPLLLQQIPLMFPKHTGKKKKAAYRFTKYVG